MDSFRKLTAKDVAADYAAVMSSVDIIRKNRGGDWPEKDMTLDEDLIDLCWHQREFEYRLSFAYTVFTLDKSNCLGCFYFYPMGIRTKGLQGYDVDISFWVTQAAYNQGLYEQLYRDLKSFVKDWPFENPYWSNEIIPSS